MILKTDTKTNRDQILWWMILDLPIWYSFDTHTAWSILSPSSRNHHRKTKNIDLRDDIWMRNDDPSS